MITAKTLKLSLKSLRDFAKKRLPEETLLDLDALLCAVCLEPQEPQAISSPPPPPRLPPLHPPRRRLRGP